MGVEVNLFNVRTLVSGVIVWPLHMCLTRGPTYVEDEDLWHHIYVNVCLVFYVNCPYWISIHPMAVASSFGRVQYGLHISPTDVSN